MENKPTLLSWTSGLYLRLLVPKVIVSIALSNHLMLCAIFICIESLIYGSTANIGEPYSEGHPPPQQHQQNWNQLWNFTVFYLIGRLNSIVLCTGCVDYVILILLICTTGSRLENEGYRIDNTCKKKPSGPFFHSFLWYLVSKKLFHLQ